MVQSKFLFAVFQGCCEPENINHWGLHLSFCHSKWLQNKISAEIFCRFSPPTPPPPKLHSKRIIFPSNWLSQKIPRKWVGLLWWKKLCRHMLRIFFSGNSLGWQKHKHGLLLIMNMLHCELSLHITYSRVLSATLQQIEKELIGRHC